MAAASKGGDFEREISKLLSKWWTDGKRDDVIWRTPASGARATQRTKVKKKTAFQYGDLTFSDDIAKPLFELFLFEIKRGYGGSKIIKNNLVEEILKKFYLNEISSKKAIEKIKNLFTKARQANQIDPLDHVDSKADNPLVFTQWWIKAEKERKEAERPYTAIIFRRDGKEDCIMLANSFIQDYLELDFLPTTKEIKIYNKEMQVSIILLEEFLSLIFPSDIRRWAAENKPRPTRRTKYNVV